MPADKGGRRPRAVGERLWRSGGFGFCRRIGCADIGIKFGYAAPQLRRDLNAAVNLVHAPDAWSAVGGASNAGAGIKIGIIDTGIDQNHPGFQDSSLPDQPDEEQGNRKKRMNLENRSYSKQHRTRKVTAPD